MKEIIMSIINEIYKYKIVDVYLRDGGIFLTGLMASVRTKYAELCENTTVNCTRKAT